MDESPVENAVAPTENGGAVPIEASLATVGSGFSFSAQLYRNIESFPGQVSITPPIMTARRENKISRRDAVRQSRHVERSNAHIHGGINRKVDMVVGSQLRMQSIPEWELLGLTKEWKKSFSRACELQFGSWANGSRKLQDAEGDSDFGGLMWLAFRHAMGPDGECYGIIHYDQDRANEYGTRWATFVQILDPQRIATPPEKEGDATVYEGHQLDKHGRTIGFWVQKDDIAEDPLGTTQYFYVPRETPDGRPIGFHWFFKERAGAKRGISRMITALRQSLMLDQFDDAQLSSAIVSAVLAMHIKSTQDPETVAEMLAPAANGGESAFDRKVAYYDKVKIRIGQQRLPVLGPNDEIVMAAVNRAAADPTAFRTGFLRYFASALETTHSSISSNHADMNYSNARSELLETWRTVISERARFASGPPRLVWNAVIEEAVFKGYIAMPAGAPLFREMRDAYTRCWVMGPGMSEIDPVKAAEANKIELETRTTTRQAIAAAKGRDYLEDFDQLAEENEEAEARDLELEPEKAPVAPAAAAKTYPSDPQQPEP